MCCSPARTSARPRRPRPSSTASPRCASPTTPPTRMASPSRWRRCSLSLAGEYDAILAGFQPVLEERAAARGGAARRDAAFRHHQGARPEELRAADLRRQRDPDRRIDRSEGHRHRAHRLVRRDRRGRRDCADRAGRGRRRSRRVELRRRGAGQVRSAGADLGEDHHLRRPRDAEGGELQDLHRAGRRQARRGDGRLARRGRRRLRAERLAGRPDRQSRRARSLHRRRNFRRHSASGRYEGFEGDRRHQQGRGGADLPGRRLRSGGRSLSRRCRNWLPNWPRLGK